MAEWLDVALGDLVDIKHGFAFQGEFFRDDPPGDVLITPGNFAIGGGFKGDKLKYYSGPVPEEYVLSAGDLIITMTDLSKEGDTLGYPAIVPRSSDRFLHNQRIGKVLGLGGQANMGFLYYLFRTREYRDEVLASATGTTVKHTAPSRIKAFRLALPPLATQQGIAEVLSALDDKIELNRRMNQTLESVARAIFRSWFVDFDPVVAKAAGRQPFGMSTDVAALFPGRFVESAIGPAPKGWLLGRLDDLVVLQRGYDLPATERTPGVYPVLSAGGPTGTHCEFKVRGPGVTTGRSGQLGAVYFVHEDFWPLNTSLYVKEFRASSPLHAYFLLQTLDFDSFNAGSAVPTLNRNHVHNLPVVVSPEKLLKHFSAFAGPLFDLSHNNEAESRTLAALRDTLLPKLMSGELRIRDAEKLAGSHV